MSASKNLSALRVSLIFLCSCWGGWARASYPLKAMWTLRFSICLCRQSCCRSREWTCQMVSDSNTSCSIRSRRGILLWKSEETTWPLVEPRMPWRVPSVSPLPPSWCQCTWQFWYQWDLAPQSGHSLLVYGRFPVPNLDSPVQLFMGAIRVGCADSRERSAMTAPELKVALITNMLSIYTLILAILSQGHRWHRVRRYDCFCNSSYFQHIV